MSRRIRFSVNIAVAAFVLVALLGLTACSRDPQRDKQKYLNSGIRYLQKQKYQEAVLQFQNALKIDPRYVDAFYQLAQARLATRDYRDAYAALQQAISLAPQRVDVRLSLGQLYRDGGQYDKAQEQADEVLKTDPKNGAAYQLKAVSFVGKQQYERAREAFSKLLELRPNDAAAHLNLGLSELSLGQRDEAEKELETAVALDRHLSQGYLNLANFYRLQKQLFRAEQVLQQGVDNNPDDRGLSLTWADFLYAQQKKDAADAVLRRLRDRQRKSAPVALGIGDFYASRKETDKALAEYRRGLDIDSKNIEIKNHMVECFLGAGRNEEAEALNGKILKQRPKDVVAGLARARILLTNGKPNDAIEQLHHLISQTQDSPQAHYTLGVAYLQNRNFAQAKAEFREALKLQPNMLAAQNSLAEVHLALHEGSEAREIAEQITHEYPADASERILLGAAYLAQREPIKAREQFEIARRLAPGQAAASFNIARTYVAQRKWAEAEKEYENALSANPRFTEALEGLAGLWTERNQRSKAIGRVEQYTVKYPEDAAGHLLLGSLRAGDKQYDGAKTEFQRAIQLDSKLGLAYVRLGNVCRSQGDIASAIQAYERALALQPTFSDLHTVVAALYLGQQNREMAKKHYEDALAIDPNSAAAANNLAWMYAREGKNLDVALSLAEKAKELQPDFVNATDTLGWIQYQKGLYAGAVPLLQECVTKSPESSVYHYHLGMALLASGEKQSGKLHLQTAMRLNLSAPDAHNAQQALNQLK